MEVTLTLTDKQHSQLRKHLYPGDGIEAVAILLCGKRDGKTRHRLMVNSIHPVPYEQCTVRTPFQLTWNVESIIPVLEQARQNKLTVVKVHSHPNGYEGFSIVDDDGDKLLLPAIESWIEHKAFHGSAVMLPDGQIFGRFIPTKGGFQSYSKITVVGDDLVYWASDEINTDTEFASSHVQLFGDETFRRLRNLSIAVVGCSGTGSPVVEQLARLGVGKLVLVDDDFVEIRNLNRILNTTMLDAETNRYKTDVLNDAVEKMGLGTKVRSIPRSLWNSKVVEEVADCDILFGCMDTVDGRYLLNSLATYYSIPYFDLGVKIVASTTAEKYGEIVEVCGSVHYLKPGFSLMSREVFSMEAVRAAGLARNDPEAYARELQDGYISGIEVYRPAVISLNMTIASLAVNELLARLHPFREEDNRKYDHIQVSLLSMDLFKENKPEPCPILFPKIGLGDQNPLLGLPELSKRVTSNGYNSTLCEAS